MPLAAPPDTPTSEARAHPQPAAGEPSAAVWRRTPRPVRIALIAAAGALALIVAGAGWTLAATSRDPAWWDGATAQAGPADAARDLAERVEQGVVRELHRWREPGETWTVALTEEQANAWAIDRLPKWIANQERWGGDAPPTVRIRFGDDIVTIGVRPDGWTHILSIGIRPAIDPDGALRIPARWAAVGRMRLPGAFVRSQAESALERWPERREAAEHLVGALVGAAPLDTEPMFDLGDGRLVRIVDVRIEPGRALITCVTERDGVQPPD